jgi:hypothetical protein
MGARRPGADANRRIRCVRARLAPTYSRAEVMARLGVGHTKLHELCDLGRRFQGVHPFKGGLWPHWPATPRNLRIEEGAILRHEEHMRKLRDYACYRAEMEARARTLADEPSRIGRFFQEASA